MKVSFIIPVYNPDTHIFRKCLKSLIQQSYKDWEAIVVFDGPNLEAEGIVKGFKDTRIQTHVKEHGGAPQARNEGFKHTTGEIVSFFDCDCAIEPDTCKTWVEAFKDHKDIAFVYSGYKFFDEKGGLPSESFDPYTLKCGNYISTMFPMRREVFPGFDESLESLQDWDMWLTIVERGGKGMFIPGYAFSTSYPTPDSISGKGCTNEAWLGRVKAVKDKHKLPYRRVCVSSLQYKEEGIRLAKLIGADYMDVPNHKPNCYDTIIQVGFSLHPSHAKLHSAIFNQPLRKKIIFWTMDNINEINNSISHKALQLYSELLNRETSQYVEDMTARKLMESAGFRVKVLPVPMNNPDPIESMPDSPRILVDTTEDYRQILGCLEHSLPDIKFDYIDSDKEIKNYNMLLTFNLERTMTFNIKRMLLTGRQVVSNVQSPFCGFVSDQQDISTYIPEMVNTIRKNIKKNTTAGYNYWKEELNSKKLVEAILK